MAEESFLYRKRKGNTDDPFVEYSQTDKVRNNKILLKEIPSKFQGLQITSELGIILNYKESGIPDSNTVVVDWKNGELLFDDTNNDKMFTIDFYGEGNVYVNAERVYVSTDENGEVTETLQTLTDETIIARDLTVATNTTVNANETTRQSNESSRVNAESTRGTNETTRQSAESTRLSNETTRQSAESLRVTAEDERESNESARILEEADRISAETTRQTNETTRQSQESTRQTNTATAISNAQDATTNANTATQSANTAATNAQSIADDTKFVEPYSTTTTYKKNNIVSFNGSSYICKTTSTNNVPPDPSVAIENEYWSLMSKKGQDGTGTVHRHKDVFEADENQTIFTLSHTYDQFSNRLDVLVGNVPQISGVNFYETSSNSFTLTVGVPAGTVVEAIYFSESVPLQSDIQTTVDNHTVEITRLASHTIFTEEFTATASQTVYTLSNTYDQFQDRIDVSVDGVPQDSGTNYTESTNNTITLSEGVPVGTKVKVKYFSLTTPVTTDVEATLNTHAGMLGDHTTKIGNFATFRVSDPDLITKMKNEFREREFNLNWYKDYATKDGSGNVTDWAPAFKQIISEATSTTNVSYGTGISIVVGYGIYQVLTSINNINKSNISIRGMGFGGTTIKSLIDDGSALFDVECLVTGHLNYFSMKDLTISGENKNAIGIRMKKTSICTFDKIRIRNFASHGMYLEEVYDSYFYGVSFTNNGKMSVDNNIATSKHALYIYNGLVDNSNRLIFTACHFEANYGSHVYSDSTGNSRKNGQIKFIGTKFHGLDPASITNCPPTPHVYLDAEVSYLESCMFFQCNHDFILVKGDRNKFTACDFHSTSGAWINLTDTSTGNATVGCMGGAVGSGRQKYEDNSTGTNFIASDMGGRKFGWGDRFIGDDGGRLALWYNMYRNNSKHQLNGANPSYATTIGTDGIDMQGIAASGSSGSVITPSSLLNVSLTRVRSYKPLQLSAVTVDATIPNNSFFLDASDNVLKFKNNSGVIKIVNLT